MLNDVSIDMSLRAKIWSEAAATVTKLNNILVDKRENKSPHERFYGTLPKYASFLRKFGEIGIVSTHNTIKMQSKLENRGTVCMMLGYARNHSGDSYRMLNIFTGKVWITRDVAWTGETYNNLKKIKLTKAEKTEPFFVEDIVSSGDNDNDENEHNNDEVEPNIHDPIAGRVEEGVTQQTKLSQELKGLQDFNNPGRKEVFFVFISIQKHRMKRINKQHYQPNSTKLGITPTKSKKKNGEVLFGWNFDK